MAPEHQIKKNGKGFVTFIYSHLYTEGESINSLPKIICNQLFQKNLLFSDRAIKNYPKHR